MVVYFYHQKYHSFRMASEQLNKNKVVQSTEEKYCRAVVDDILKMFNEQRCFYYCLDGDITVSERIIADGEVFFVKKRFTEERNKQLFK